MLGLLLVGFFISNGCCTPRPWTLDEKILLGASCVAAAADAYTTTRALDNPNNWEINPVIGKRPSDSKVVITLGVSQILTIVLAH